MKTKFNIRTIIEAIIIILIIVDIVLLVLITFYNLNPYFVNLIIYFDLGVCVILFLDFIYRMNQSEYDKWTFIKKNWVSIIAMIPFNFLVFRLFRLTRLLRLLTILNLIRLPPLVETDIKYALDFFKQTHLDKILGIVFFALFSGTILFYMVEHGNNPGIHSVWDAFWYIITITISGNSDINPDTFIGELITIPMMLIGIIFVGVFAAAITTHLVKKSEKEIEAKEESQIDELKGLILVMQSEINELKDLIKNNK